MGRGDAEGGAAAPHQAHLHGAVRYPKRPPSLPRLQVDRHMLVRPVYT